jgi:hypothetical protein
LMDTPATPSLAFAGRMPSAISSAIGAARRSRDPARGYA